LPTSGKRMVSGNCNPRQECKNAGGGNACDVLPTSGNPRQQCNRSHLLGSLCGALPDRETCLVEQTYNPRQECLDKNPAVTGAKSACGNLPTVGNCPGTVTYNPRQECLDGLQRASASATPIAAVGAQLGSAPRLPPPQAHLIIERVAKAGQDTLVTLKNTGNGPTRDIDVSVRQFECAIEYRSGRLQGVWSFKLDRQAVSPPLLPGQSLTVTARNIAVDTSPSPLSIYSYEVYAAILDGNSDQVDFGFKDPPPCGN